VKRVVITGIGIVSPLGHDVEEFGRRMFAGESGVVNIRGTFVHENFPVPYAALVDNARLPLAKIFGDAKPETVSKFWNFAAYATEQALAGVAPGTGVDAIIYGTAEGASFDIVSQVMRGQLDQETFDWRTATAETSLDLIARIVKKAGLGEIPVRRQIAINSACASGNQAIGMAFERIRSGEWTRALAGGVDARCDASNLMNFHMLGALSTAEVPPATASRPFAGDRTGFIRGEGAATLLLESLESAQARGAKIYGEVIGYANTSDAYRLTDGRDDGSCVIQAMSGAIASAGLKPEQIDYISAHGTSTKLNDRLETLATKAVFGDRAKQVPMSSLKSQIGHSTVAAGAIESVACLLILREQKVAPTINYHVADPECDLDYVPNVSRAAKVDTILSNNFGFGGQNACLVFRKI
jgi:3-oxoacyl-(acyl-carrier-protein) synthase